MHILIVDDARIFREALALQFGVREYATTIVETAEDAISVLSAAKIDLVITEINLPDTSGFDLISQIRARKIDVPLMVVSADHTVESKIKALDSGADDYVTKPYDDRILFAKIGAVSRRYKKLSSPIVTVGHVSINVNRKLAFIRDELVDLTPSEYKILELLMVRRGEVVSRKDIYEHVYESSKCDSSTIDRVYISKLRKKLREYGVDDFIDTHMGCGYIIP